MAVTVLQRPLGFILGDSVSANINEAYAGYATVNKSGHGFSDGDYVYIVSNVESYNGFWYVNIEDGNKFKIRQYPTADDQAYIIDANITYYEIEETHGVSCVHLPITYRLSTDIFPNTADTPETILSFNNDSGYVNINITGALNTVAPFEFITVNGVVIQVLEVVSNTSFTIALLYDSTLNLVGQSVLKYYSNYNFVVRVYGGLNASHEWASKKPYQLLGTFNLIPDSNGEVVFSISELLRSQIKTNNNLLIDTFPNNIDAFTQFYISYAESYDDSLGTNYALGTYTSSFTDDSFEGMAVNAKLPFKGIHSGHLSEYIMNRTTAKFLTLFTIPVLFSCEDECYNDISFINNYNGANLTLRQTLFIDDVEQTTTDTSLGVNDKGIIRAELPQYDCNFDRVDLSILGTIEQSVSDFQQTNNGVESVTLNISGVPPYTSNSLQSQLAAGETSNIAYYIYLTAAGSYSFDLYTDVNVLSGTGTYRITIYLLDRNFNVLDSDQHIVSAGPTNVDNSVLTISESSYYFGIMFEHVSGSGSVILNTGIDPQSSLLPVTISETIQAIIDCGCSNQNIKLTWLNYLGGFDYWNFTAEKEYQVEIEDSGKTKKNIFPEWPKSYGQFADTIEKQTYRKSRNVVLVRSQYVTQDQMEAIKYIKTSPLVQIVNSRQDRRTVIVDTDSFTVRKDRQDLFEISFSISYTDEIPSQMV